MQRNNNYSSDGDMQDLGDKGMAEGVGTIACHTFTKERHSQNLKQCQNYHIFSLTGHPSKIMLRVILNRLKAKAEELLAEGQAGFRPGRGTIEQNFNSRGIIEKCLQHQCDLFHNFMNFKTVLTESGMQVRGRPSEASTWRKDWFKPFRHYTRTPAVQSS